MNKLNNDKLVVYIPFEGFYNSLLGALVDDSIELLMLNNDEVGLSNNFEVDYKEMHKVIAKGYAEQWLHEAGLEGKFAEFFVPKYFNYGHEQIGIEFNADNLAKIKELAFRDENNFSIFVKENCSSRSGFISSVNNDLSNWGSDWASNQYFVALLFLESEENYSEQVIDRLQGNGYFEVIEL